MKEPRRYKRFDLLSTLAVFGVLAVLLFESFFIFELYSKDLEPLKRFIPLLEDSSLLLEVVEESVPVG